MLVSFMKLRFLLLALLALVSACATDYQSSGLTGGFTEKQLEPEIWRLNYGGNGYTTVETVQTYWLYRASELSLEKGYDGFEILTPIRFVGLPELRPGEIQFAHATPVYIPIYTGGGSVSAGFEGDIRLLKKPLSPKPPAVFDARDLKSTLDPFVHGKKCDMGNVCPHVHRYLMISAPPLPPAP
jgi:hypothetical protein